MTCDDCLNGNHDEVNLECDCPCHPHIDDPGKEMEKYEYGMSAEDTFKQEASQYVFPNVTTEEITLYLKVLAGEGDKAQKLSKEDVEDTPLVNFLAEVGKVSMDSKAYQKLIGHLKMMLVMANRTTGLTNAYLSGVAIGFFLAKPEALPSGDSSMEENNVVQ